MNDTFSRTTQGTRRRSSNRKISPTNPERAPPIPAVRPAWLRSWQGKPPAINSVSRGRDLSSRTSRLHETSGILAARTARAGSQISQSKLGSCPAAANPRSSPPMPANKPATFTSNPNRFETQLRTRSTFLFCSQSRFLLTHRQNGEAPVRNGYHLVVPQRFFPQPGRRGRPSRLCLARRCIRTAWPKAAAGAARSAAQGPKIDIGARMRGMWR
ncbi:hypothetical protein M2175_003801 [Bradyrhizobium elkanii]|nr:hypothetical protein [Bradyrhizobium elkanii]MCS3969324.1 hypothetical protein [Bradyrhizobium japonicum]